jgi:hypothetical protein
LSHDLSNDHVAGHRTVQADPPFHRIERKAASHNIPIGSGLQKPREHGKKTFAAGSTSECQGGREPSYPDRPNDASLQPEYVQENRFQERETPQLLELLPMSASLTAAERRVLDALVLAWEQFIQLGDPHPDDRDEFKRAIHAAQNIVAFRVARRVDPEAWSPAVAGGSASIPASGR